jgi:predicted nucleic acid-binding Zn ribbon protein
MIFNKRRFRVPTCVERDEAYTINKKKNTYKSTCLYKKGRGWWVTRKREKQVQGQGDSASRREASILMPVD